MKTITTSNLDLCAIAMGIASAVQRQTEEFVTQYHSGLITIQELVFKISDATKGIAHVRTPTEILYPIPEYDIHIILAFFDLDEDFYHYRITIEPLDPRNPPRF